MKLPMMVVKDYKDYLADNVYLIESHEANYLNINNIARELNDEEMEEYLNGIDENEFEELIFGLLEKGEDDNEQ
jgi:hypothetical protein